MTAIDDFTAPNDRLSQLELKAFTPDAGAHPTPTGIVTSDKATLTPDAWVGLHLSSLVTIWKVRFLRWPLV